MAIDYDPQKAHEYYEKHKNLKGRKSHSTKGWSQQKKEQWAYAKEQLKQEHSAIGKNITQTSKSLRQQMSDAAKEKISALRESIKNLPKEQKIVARLRIKGMIDSIRADLKADKKELTENTKGFREKEKQDYSARKDLAYNRIKAGAK